MKASDLAEQCFESELADIKFENKELYITIRNIFDALCPASFWTAPSSSSGEYHPQFANRAPGGLVLHTRYVVFLASAFLETCFHTIPRKNRASIIGACILHDLLKTGKRIPRTDIEWLNHKDQVTQHGTRLANEIASYLMDLKDVITDEEELMIQGIRTHMGKFTIPENERMEYLPDTEDIEEFMQVSRIVHFADLVASMRETDFTDTI